MRKFFALLIAASLSVTALTAPIASAGITEKTNLVSYTYYDNDNNGAWYTNGSVAAARTTEADGNKYMKLEQSAFGDAYYLASIKVNGSAVATGLGADVITNEGNITASKIVGKARLNYLGGGTAGGNNTDYAEFGLTNNTGGRLRLMRVASNNKISINRALRNLSSDKFDETNVGVVSSTYHEGDWANLMYVINVDADGNAKIDYYVNGSKYSKNGTTEYAMAGFNTNTAKHMSVQLHSTTGTGITPVSAGLDNAGLYAVPLNALPAFEASLAESTELDPKADITINFSNEIYLNGLKDMISVNGENVDLSRMTVGDDQQSVTISAPEDGYPSSSEITVAFGSDLTDVLGSTISTPSLTFTTNDTVYETFKSDSVDAGTTDALATSSSVSIHFTGNIDADYLSGVTLSKKSGASVDTANYSVEMTTPDTLKVSFTGLETNNEYVIDYSSLQNVNGIALTGDTTYSFRTRANSNNLNRVQDFESFNDADVPQNDTANGFYYASRPGNTYIEEIGSKKYCWINTDEKDNNVGVRANASFKYYDADLEYKAVFSIISGQSASAQTRIRINNSDSDQANIILFSKDASVTDGGVIGILGYASETDKCLVSDWTYTDNVVYTVRIQFVNYGTDDASINVYITGENGDDYKCENIKLSENNFYTGASSSASVATAAKNANGVYIYSNGATGDVRNSVCLDEFGITKLQTAEPIFTVSQPEISVNASDVSVSAAYVNTTENNNSSVMIIAQYEGGVLKSVTSTPVSFAANTESSQVSGSDTVYDGADSIKAYIWNSSDGMLPQSDSGLFTVE